MVFTTSSKWEGALSCNKDRLPTARNCGLTQEMHFNKSSHILNVENIIVSLSFMHKFFMNHLVCQKMWPTWFCSWTSANDTFWVVVMTSRSIACPEVSSLSHIEIPMTYLQLRCSQEHWDCLDKSGWSLGMMWASVVSARPWVSVGQTLRRPSSSLSLHGGFDKSSPYRCLTRLTSFAEPISDFLSPFHGHLQLFPPFEVEGHPLLGSSWRYLRPALNRLNHSDTLLWLKASSPGRVCNIS
jgi:hypothetical protein